MKKDISHTLVIALLLFLASFLIGCCPKITESVQTTVRTDTVTIYEADTILVPGSSESFDLDFNRICDSLSKGRPITISEKKNKTTITVAVPATGLGQIICNEDSLQMVIDSLRKYTTIQTDSTFLTTKVVWKCDKKFHTFAVAWFFFSVLAATIAIVIWTKNYRR